MVWMMREEVAGKLPSKTDEYGFDQELIKYYTAKVELLEDARRHLKKYERKRRSGNSTVSSSGRYESEEEFNMVLDDLMFFAWPKIKKSSNIEVPDELSEGIDDSVYNCNSLDMGEKKRLVYLIRDLFESMNITSLEREKWEADGLGAVSKEGGN